MLFITFYCKSVNWRIYTAVLPKCSVEKDMFGTKTFYCSNYINLK